MRGQYLENNTNETYMLALTQSFEIVVELSWKVLKDYLIQNNLDVNLPNEVIKEAFANEVIKNGQIWIDMIKARNISSHEYNIEKINTTLKDISEVYYKELVDFTELIKGF